jgi:hypothetical protein
MAYEVLLGWTAQEPEPIRLLLWPGFDAAKKITILTDTDGQEPGRTASE